MTDLIELDARVRTLEDLVQKIRQAFISPPSTPTAQKTPPIQVSAFSKILSALPADLQNKIYPDGNKIKLTEFIGQESWKTINHTLTENGYIYVKSSGQEKAHWTLK